MTLILCLFLIYYNIEPKIILKKLNLSSITYLYTQAEQSMSS